MNNDITPTMDNYSVMCVRNRAYYLENNIVFHKATQSFHILSFLQHRVDGSTLRTASLVMAEGNTVGFLQEEAKTLHTWLKKRLYIGRLPAQTGSVPATADINKGSCHSHGSCHPPRQGITCKLLSSTFLIYADCEKLVPRRSWKDCCQHEMLRNKPCAHSPTWHKH